MFLYLLSYFICQINVFLFIYIIKRENWFLLMWCNVLFSPSSFGMTSYLEIQITSIFQNLYALLPLCLILTSLTALSSILCLLELCSLHGIMWDLSSVLKQSHLNPLTSKVTINLPFSLPLKTCRVSTIFFWEDSLSLPLHSSYISWFTEGSDRIILLPKNDLQTLFRFVSIFFSLPHFLFSILPER